jgi:hypothetical protein
MKQSLHLAGWHCAMTAMMKLTLHVQGWHCALTVSVVHFSHPYSLSVQMISLRFVQSALQSGHALKAGSHHHGTLPIAGLLAAAPVSTLEWAELIARRGEHCLASAKMMPSIWLFLPCRLHAWRLI